MLGTRDFVDGTLDLRVIEGDGDETLLTSDPRRPASQDPGPFGPIQVIVGSDGTFVRLDQSSRSGAASYLWSLTDPCTAYAGDPTATTIPTTSTAPGAAPAAPAGPAAPATPVSAEAAFTG